jgi:hypothetical protein
VIVQKRRSADDDGAEGGEGGDDDDDGVAVSAGLQQSHVGKSGVLNTLLGLACEAEQGDGCGAVDVAAPVLRRSMDAPRALLNADAVKLVCGVAGRDTTGASCVSLRCAPWPCVALRCVVLCCVVLCCVVLCCDACVVLPCVIESLLSCRVMVVPLLTALCPMCRTCSVAGSVSRCCGDHSRSHLDG